MAKARLERALKLCEIDLKMNPSNAQAHYAKAGLLLKLKDAAGDGLYNKEELGKQALECYNKAIGINPEAADYFADRSKLHIAMGNTDLAAEDIKKVKDLPESNNPITAMYLNNTVRDIAKLEAVQSTVAQLQKDGKIDPALASALAEHAKVTASLVVQVGAHGARLNGRDQEIGNLQSKTEELIAMVQALYEGKKVDSDQIAKLMQDTSALKGALDQNTVRIQGIEEQLRSTVIDMKKGIASNKESDAIKSILETKINSIESQLGGLTKQQDVSKIVVEMKKMIGENKFTKDSIDDLQDQIDALTLKGDSNVILVNMLSNITYTNPLLNYPELMKSVVTLGDSSLSQILDLGSSLDKSLIDEAIKTNDIQLILAGLASLDCDHL